MPPSRSALSRYFWPAQLTAWGLYALQQFIGLLPGWKGSYQALPLLDAALGCAVTLALREVYRRTWHLPLLPRIAAGTAALFIAAVAYALVWARLVAGICTTCTTPDSGYGYVSWIGTATYLLIAWSGGYLGIKLAHQAQQAREWALRATASAQQAQLRMLRYQLNPHFLFNALNTLSTRMVEREDEEGEAMVEALAGFLRYSLDSDPEQGVPLEEELAAMRRYLAIEQARFGARLHVDYDIDPETLRLEVPSLILQPLMENAIKHAIAPRVEGGCIAIVARREDDMLDIAIDDDGAGSADYGNGRGVGLRNVRERLQVLYGTRQRFALTALRPHGTRARMRLPAQVASATPRSPVS